MNFDFTAVVWMIAGAYAIYSGMKKYKERNIERNYKYTMESVKKFYTWYGILMSAIGVILFWGAAVKIFNLPYILVMINVFAMVAIGIAIFILYKTMLVKK